MKEKKKIKPLTLDAYLAVIKNSVGSKLFRNFYVKIDGIKTDVMRNGDLSCAFYVYSILKIFGLISRIHGTVDSTISDLKKIGWKEIRKPKAGAVLIWEELEFSNGEHHKHIGFYIGDGKAISNSDRKKFPVDHLWRKSGRKVEAIFWNDKLEFISKR